MLIANTADAQVAKLQHFFRLDLDEGHIGLHIIQGHRKADRLLLPLERAFQIMYAVDEDPVTGDKSRPEKGKALNVVPMGMAKEQMDHPLPLTAISLH